MIYKSDDKSKKNNKIKFGAEVAYFLLLVTIFIFLLKFLDQYGFLETLLNSLRMTNSLNFFIAILSLFLAALLGDEKV